MSLNQIINILLTTFLTMSIFYLNGLRQDITKMRTGYLTDVVTLNNSFITLTHNACTQNISGYQTTSNNLQRQMDKFNERYDVIDTKLSMKEERTSRVDKIVYILAGLIIILNAGALGIIIDKFRSKA